MLTNLIFGGGQQLFSVNSILTMSLFIFDLVKTGHTMVMRLMHCIFMFVMSIMYDHSVHDRLCLSTIMNLDS
jgi:hypothetical protein